MKKLITSKIFILTLIAFVFLGNLLQLYYYINREQFTISHGKNSTLIVFPKGQYMQMLAYNDLVDDGINTTNRPFNDDTDVEHDTNGINFLGWQKTYTERAINKNNTRVNRVVRAGNNSVIIDLKINSDYKPTIPTTYIIQLDYSSPITMTTNNNSIVAKTKYCETMIKKIDGYDYSLYKSQSIRIKRAYKTQMNWEINLEINCK